MGASKKLHPLLKPCPTYSFCRRSTACLRGRRIDGCMCVPVFFEEAWKALGCNGRPNMKLQAQCRTHSSALARNNVKPFEVFRKPLLNPKRRHSASLALIPFMLCSVSSFTSRRTLRPYKPIQEQCHKLKVLSLGWVQDGKLWGKAAARVVPLYALTLPKL